MEFTRNRYFMSGMLLILLGIQFRMVHSFVLNEPATRTLIKLSKNGPVAANNTSPLNTLFMQVTPSPRKQVVPPRWLGLAMVAVGVVISLHALAMPRTN